MGEIIGEESTLSLVYARCRKPGSCISKDCRLKGGSPGSCVRMCSVSPRSFAMTEPDPFLGPLFFRWISRVQLRADCKHRSQGPSLVCWHLTFYPALAPRLSQFGDTILFGGIGRMVAISTGCADEAARLKGYWVSSLEVWPWSALLPGRYPYCS